VLSINNNNKNKKNKMYLITTTARRITVGVATTIKLKHTKYK